jgi:outer membrane protein assembly factor BamB
MSSAPLPRLARRSLLVLSWLAAACSTASEDENASRPTTGDEQDIVYGKDDRYDVYAHPNSALRALAQNSIVALMKSSDVTTNADDSISLKSPRLGDREVFYKDYEGLKLCSTERFLNDPTAAFCSGTLIADDLVLTAGHCFEDTSTCGTTSFVFGYYNDAEDALHPITSADVFTCKEVIAQRYDRITKQEGADTPYQPNLDYTIVRIDRSAAPRFQPARVRTAVEALPEHQGLAVIGFGNGQPAKIDAGGKVVANNAERLDYFDASLDASWGNSGSGVFDLATLDLVGIHVRGQGDNFEAKGDCAVVKVCPERGCEDGKVKSITYSHGAVNRLCDTEPSAALCADHQLPARVAYTFGVRKPLTGAPLAGPDGRVVVVDTDGVLHSLDAQGHEAWQAPGKLRYNSPPAFAANGDLLLTRTNGTIVALAADGQERWSYAATSGIAQPAVAGADGQVYFLSSDGTLVALDEAGQTSWVWKGDWQYPSAIAISPTDGDLVVAAGKVLYRLQKTGELRWKIDLVSNVKRGVAFAEDGSVVFTGDAGGLVRIATDGAVVFSLDAPELKNLGPIAVVGDAIVTSRFDTLIAKNLADGLDRWSFPTKNTIRGAVVAAGPTAEKTLYFGGMDGLVYALRPDGSLIFTVRTEGGIEATPAVDTSGRVFVNSLDGRLYVLGTGE